MQELRIIENGNIYDVDLGREETIKINKIGNNLGDILSRRIEFSNTITLPNTFNNRNAFGLNSDRRQDVNTSLKKRFRTIFYSGGQLIVDGYSTVNNLSQDNIKINIYSTELDFIDRLESFQWNNWFQDDDFRDNILLKDPNMYDHLFTGFSIIQYIAPLHAGSPNNDIWPIIPTIGDEIYFPYRCGTWPTDITANNKFEEYESGTDDEQGGTIPPDTKATTFYFGYGNPYQSRPSFNIMATLRIIFAGMGYTLNYQATGSYPFTENLEDFSWSAIDTSLDKDTNQVNSFGEIHSLQAISPIDFSTKKTLREILSDIIKTFGIFFYLEGNEAFLYSYRSIKDQELQDLSSNLVLQLPYETSLITSENIGSVTEVRLTNAKSPNKRFVELPNYKRQPKGLIELPLSDVNDISTRIRLEDTNTVFNRVEIVDDITLLRVTGIFTTNAGKNASNNNVIFNPVETPLSLFHATVPDNYTRYERYVHTFADISNNQIFGINEYLEVLDEGYIIEAYFRLSPYEYNNLKLYRPVYVERLPNTRFIISEVAEYQDEKTPVKIKLITY